MNKRRRTYFGVLLALVFIAATVAWLVPDRVASVIQLVTTDSEDHNGAEPNRLPNVSLANVLTRFRW